MPVSKRRIKNALWAVIENGFIVLYDSYGVQVKGIRKIKVTTGKADQMGKAKISAYVNVATREEMREATNVTGPRITAK